MKRCLICLRYYIKEENRSFHRFPKNITLRKKWLDVLQIDPRNMTIYNYICSDHFKQEDFYVTPSGKRTIKKFSFPSVFTRRSHSVALMYQGASTSGASVQQITAYKKERPINGIDTNGSEKENVIADDTPMKLNLSSNFSENSTINSELVENLYNLSPAIEIHIKNSESDEEDVTIPESVVEDVFEDSERNEISNAAENYIHSETGKEVNVPTNNPAEETIQCLSDSSTLTAMSEDPYATDNPEDPEDTASASSSASIVSKTHLAFEEKVAKRRNGLRFFGDCSIEDLDNPKRARASWHIARKKILEQKRKIRNLQMQNRRLKSRIINLNSLLTHLFHNYEFQKKG